ncbi:MAG: hypothetical protein AAF289_09945 [Cyanobacteria bacterium P01_A01_bin.135]
MLNYRHILAVCAGVLLPLAVAGPVRSERIQTPIQTHQVRGTSGGDRQTSCGFIGSPALQIQVTEPMASLQFRVTGGGSPTLYVTSGQTQDCAMSDSLSGGAVELPGVWEQGSYRVFVGDRNGDAHPYQLSVTQR